MIFHWFSSSQFRRTSEMWRNLTKLRDAQRDILSAENLQSLDSILQQTQVDLDARASDEVLAARADELELAAHDWLQPYPNAEWRENIEVLLVAIALAMAIRTFFAQPFKIPTGSMQPTLYGITVEDLRNDTNFVMPGFFGRAYDVAFLGTIYHQVLATADCAYDHVDPVQHFLGFINKQVVWIRYAGGVLAPVTIYCGPDESIESGAGLVDNNYAARRFHKGQPIVQFVERVGDHLFVDRFTYNFRRPDRGEIIVFKTKNIPGITLDQFYIKRLIGLPGDTISIGEDRHVRINGVRLDASTPHFKGIYGFDPGVPRRDSHYSGHILEGDYRSHLKTPEDQLKVRPRHYAVFGDNTVNSSDSRYWGDFPEQNIVGRAWLVYWPCSSRFGFLGNR